MSYCHALFFISVLQINALLSPCFRENRNESPRSGPVIDCIFTADLRRQLTNDRCNSSAFHLFSWGDEFFLFVLEAFAFFCFALKTFAGGVAELRTTVTEPCFESFFFFCFENFCRNFVKYTQYGL